MVLYPPALHQRRARDHYKTPRELAIGFLAGLQRAGMSLPTPIHDCCAGDGALIERLGVDGRGSDLFPDAYSPDPRLHPTRSTHAIREHWRRFSGRPGAS